MKKESINVLPVFIIIGVLLLGCVNIQPTVVDTKKSIKPSSLDNPNNESETRESKRRKLGLTRLQYYGERDPGDILRDCVGLDCVGEKVELLVYKNKVEEAKKEIKKLTKLIISVEMIESGSCFSVSYYRSILDPDQRNEEGSYYRNYAKYVDLENAVCLMVTTYPGKETETTLALEKLDIVLYTIVTPEDMGGELVMLPENDFETKGEGYLKKENSLDNAKLTKNQDDSLKSNYVNKE